MNYQVIQPCEELQDYISHFWVSRLNNNEPAHFTYYSTANVLTELAFAFKPSQDRHLELIFSSIQGHTERFGQFSMSGVANLFGVSLYSYAIPCFFDVSPSDLTHQLIDLDTLLGKQGSRINEEMVNTVSIQNRIHILTEYFKMQLAKRQFKDCRIINAIKQIRKHKGMVSISDLASEFCLSQKQFERRFKVYSGFNPKLYARIIRFEAALWDRRCYNSLTEVAYAYGYYDQAHFIREFKMFSGFSPHKFFSLAGY